MDSLNVMQADRIFYNGAIYTADHANRLTEALAVGGGKVLCAGSTADAGWYKGPKTEMIDLQGKMITPGFIDTHLHAPGRVLSDLYNISLYDTAGLPEILQQVDRFIKEHPEQDIYYGEGFSLGHFSGEEVSRGPRKERLDQICADKPVILYSSDCHLAWLNSCAMKTFGVTGETPDPQGGLIEKDPRSGNPWGTLKEAAMRLIPEQQFSEEQVLEALTHFQSYLHSLGYTGIHSVSITAEPPLQAFFKLEQQGRLKLHVASSVTVEPLDDLPAKFARIKTLRERYSRDRHRVTTAKFFADGVVEGATAYLVKPYQPGAGKEPDYRGDFLWNQDKLKEAFSLANRAGLQVHVHSIGDAATSLVLDALEKTTGVNPAGCRNTITHLQLVDPADLKRFAALNVIASVQPYWHCKEPDWWSVVDYHMLGERAEDEYPLQSLFAAGITVVSSSDHPVTPHPNPLRALRAGITRNLTAEASYGLLPLDHPENTCYLLNRGERASLIDMIRSFTINGAFAIFREQETGSLEPGKQADLVVFDRDLFTTAPGDLEKICLLETYFAGEPVYRSSAG